MQETLARTQSDVQREARARAYAMPSPTNYFLRAFSRAFSQAI